MYFSNTLKTKNKLKETLMPKKIIVESDLVGKFNWEVPHEIARNFNEIGIILRKQHPPEIAQKMEEFGLNEMRDYVVHYLEMIVAAYGIGGPVSNKIRTALKQKQLELMSEVQTILKSTGNAGES